MHFLLVKHTIYIKANLSQIMANRWQNKADHSLLSVCLVTARHKVQSSLRICQEEAEEEDGKKARHLFSR